MTHLSDPNLSSKVPDEQVVNRSELLQLVIRNAMMNQFVYSQMSFDNATDTVKLHYAANENAEMLVQAVIAMLEKRVEQMLTERIETALIKGEMAFRVGDSWYKVTDMLQSDSDTKGKVNTNASNKSEGGKDL